jgi:hypothetical protein
MSCTEGNDVRERVADSVRDGDTGRGVQVVWLYSLCSALTLPHVTVFVTATLVLFWVSAATRSIQPPHPLHVCTDQTTVVIIRVITGKTRGVHVKRVRRRFCMHHGSGSICQPAEQRVGREVAIDPALTFHATHAIPFSVAVDVAA